MEPNMKTNYSTATTLSQNDVSSNLSSRLVTYVAVMLLGVSILAVAGHAQTPTLHGAAHDTRHATGFPCH
jgi:cobalt transporter subunit CbtB